MLGKTENSNEIILNDDLLSEYKIMSIENNTIVLQKNNKKYICRFLYKDNNTGISYIKINGILKKVTLFKEIEKLLSQIIQNYSNSSEDDITELNAPMPGTILEIKVSKGDKVKKDDPLLILEAMKMENVLTSPKDGVISEVIVKINETVDKGTVLLNFEK
jgi:biotin carboxyl carrier protein